MTTENTPILPSFEAVTAALEKALGAIDAMATQIEQMKGLFPDDDGTIEDAIQAGDEAGSEGRALLVAMAESKVTAPAMIVTMDGGLIQHLCANMPIEVMVVDYDYEGATEDEISRVRQTEGAGFNGEEDALISLGDVDQCSPWLVAERLSKFRETDGKVC